jgi:hypothetical protein
LSEWFAVGVDDRSRGGLAQVKTLTTDTEKRVQRMSLHTTRQGMVFYLVERHSAWPAWNIKKKEVRKRECSP